MARAKPAAASADSGDRGVILADEGEWVRALWYSDPGKGKTTAMAALANLGHIVYFDVEKRLHNRALQRVGIKTDNIEVYRPPFTYDRFEALSFDLLGRIEDGEPIIGVCFDSMTELYREMLEQIVNADVARRTLTGKGGQRSEFERTGDDYSELAERVRILLRRYRDLPVHLGFSARTRRDVVEDGGMRVGPAVTPAIMKDLTGYVDLVLYCQYDDYGDGDEQYSALTRPAGRFEAKDAFGVFPPVWCKPWFDRAVGYVNEEITRTDDPEQIRARDRARRLRAAALAETDTNTTAEAPADANTEQ